MFGLRKKIEITRKHSWRIEQRLAESTTKYGNAIPTLRMEMSKEICRNCGLIRYRDYDTGQVVKTEEPEGWMDTCTRKTILKIKL